MLDYSLNIAGSEWMIIIFVAVILILGTGKLPGVAKKLGKAVNEYNKAKNEIQEQMKIGEEQTPTISGPVETERAKLETIAKSIGIKVEEKTDDDVEGQWTQKVYQVDDSPRYEGSATWVHVDGKSYWENTTTAPLPRREYTKRSDYNVTLRGNRHEITQYGWLHDQDNAKVIREKGQDDVILAHEKGYNTYVKVEDSRCQAAQDWWKANFDKWATVRAKWDEVYGRDKDLVLEEKVDNKVLYKHLFDEEMTAEKDIDTTIESFVKK